VALVVLDASAGITSQDQAVVGQALDARRPPVLAFNKWDLVEAPDELGRRLDDLLARRLGFAGRLPRVTLSALTGQRAFRVLDALDETARSASRRIATSELNRFLESTLAEHLSGGGTAPKTFYMTQTGVLPPRFVIFCRKPERISPAFRRFVENRIRRAFGFEKVPVGVSFRAAPRRA
jgi:GTP-binding protein